MAKALLDENPRPDPGRGPGRSGRQPMPLYRIRQNRRCRPCGGRRAWKGGRQNEHRPVCSRQASSGLWSGDKATGAADYSVDVCCRGCWSAELLHSPHAHARIRSVDKTRALALPGVKAVLTWEDVSAVPFNPSVQDCGLHDTSQRDRRHVCHQRKGSLRWRHRRGRGGLDDATATEALELIDMDYEVLPAVFDMLEAMKPAPRSCTNPSVATSPGVWLLPATGATLKARLGTHRWSWRRPSRPPSSTSWRSSRSVAWLSSLQTVG